MKAYAILLAGFAVVGYSYWHAKFTESERMQWVWILLVAIGMGIFIYGFHLVFEQSR